MSHFWEGIFNTLLQVHLWSVKVKIKSVSKDWNCLYLELRAPPADRGRCCRCSCRCSWMKSLCCIKLHLNCLRTFGTWLLLMKTDFVCSSSLDSQHQFVPAAVVWSSRCVQADRCDILLVPTNDQTHWCFCFYQLRVLKVDTNRTGNLYLSREKSVV